MAKFHIRVNYNVGDHDRVGLEIYRQDFNHFPKVESRSIVSSLQLPVVEADQFLAALDAGQEQVPDLEITFEEVLFGAMPEEVQLARERAAGGAWRPKTKFVKSEL